MRGLPGVALPDLQLCIDRNLEAARLTNPNPYFAGVAINTARLDEAAAERLLKETSEALDLPAVDPLRQGVAPIVDRLG